MSCGSSWLMGGNIPLIKLYTMYFDSCVIVVLQKHAEFIITEVVLFV